MDLLHKIVLQLIEGVEALADGSVLDVEEPGFGVHGDVLTEDWCAKSDSAVLYMHLPASGDEGLDGTEDVIYALVVHISSAFVITPEP